MHSFLEQTHELRPLFGETKANFAKNKASLTISVIGWACGVGPTALAPRKMPQRERQADSMPSSPTATDDQPIDLQHLRRMTLGDRALEREVLGIFLAQTARPIGDLVISVEPTALAHRLMGSARAIGAFRIAECAAALECAIQGGDNPSQILFELDHAVAQARATIEAMLKRS
jgi:hypothetical protein